MFTRITYSLAVAAFAASLSGPASATEPWLDHHWLCTPDQAEHYIYTFELKFDAGVPSVKAVRLKNAKFYTIDTVDETPKHFIAYETLIKFTVIMRPNPGYPPAIGELTTRRPDTTKQDHMPITCIYKGQKSPGQRAAEKPPGAAKPRIPVSPTP